ncbi:MAG: hypothetical protein WBG30_04960 [Psychrilyobacter sp.]|uniref:hypothetical protein n=1 Tax=Psychrilyobacter sp. TaxID=2586924 RepID=UPI003C779164
MRTKNFLQSQFIFWSPEEVKSDLSKYKSKLSLCLSYKEKYDIVFAKEPVEIQIKDPKIIMMGKQELKRVEEKKLFLEDSLNEMFMYFNREKEYLFKIFFQTFYTLDDVTLTKQSRKETKKNMGFKRHKILKERPPEIKEIMVLLI